MSDTCPPPRNCRGQRVAVVPLYFLLGVVALKFPVLDAGLIS